MYFNRKFITFFIIFLINFSYVYSQEQDSELQNNGSIEIINYDESIEKEIQNRFLYLKGCYEHANNKMLPALVSLNKISDTSDYSYNQKIRLYFDLEKFDKIIELKDIIKNKFKDSWEIQFLLANSYLNLNQDKQAEEILNELIEKFPDNEQIAYYKAVCYIKNMQLAKALEFIDKCIKNKSLRNRKFLFYFLKSKIYIQMGLNQTALDSITKSLKLFPKFEKGWLLKALLEEQLGKTNAAISGYKKFLDIFGSDINVEKQLAQLLFSQERFKEASEILRKMDIDNPAFYYSLALTEWKSENFEKAKIAIDRALQKMPNSKKIKLLNIDILISLNKKDGALNFLKNWFKETPEDNNIVRFILLLKYAGLDQEKIINTLEELHKNKTKNITLLMALADLYLEKNNYEKVEELCNKILAQTKEEKLKSRILFQKAYVNFQANKTDKIEEILKKAIKYQDNYAPAYNLLAYYYAQKNKNLNQALELIELALKLEAKSSCFLDTKSYILYKMGKNKEAIKILQQALNLSPDDKIIKEHLLEIKKEK
ncbi:tetratricopeptide repeat protein [Candidatus Babeliales bacterium]|nr:tetratricopeptide repeat protein [Candidatus Babeliales bacterium]MCF7899335.1 tetratricopeptide repeat protein [Candidatus Babeliales bacterium]